MKEIHRGQGPPLPTGVSYTWQRVSRRQVELVVKDGADKVIFHAMTDGRGWSLQDVCELLRVQAGRLDPMGVGE